MKIAVDISLYPLDADYVPPIKDFIARLNRDRALQVNTNAMSTQIAGELDQVFAALGREIGTSFATGGRSVFVLKVLGGEPTSAE